MTGDVESGRPSAMPTSQNRDMGHPVLWLNLDVGHPPPVRKTRITLSLSLSNSNLGGVQ